jgi:UDP-N-acetyl-D-mannosaminuronic acid dehydrogenase
MMINEGLPNFIVNQMKAKYKLHKRKVGILGMAFKANVDDVRDSLSFKLSKILKFNGAEVLCSDEYAQNPEFISKEELVSKSETIIIGAPHSSYENLQFPPNIEIIDIWNILPTN